MSVIQSYDSLRVYVPADKVISTKFCKDCKHIAVDSTFQDHESKFKYARCQRTGTEKQVDVVDIVSGELFTATFGTPATFCHVERGYSALDNTCGKEGKFWEPKE